MARALPVLAALLTVAVTGAITGCARREGGGAGGRYVVGFYPANKERDGKRRRVQVEVRGHPEYTVWGRKSYYAPGT